MSILLENNIYDSPSGDYRAFADDYFIFLDPLPAGNHDVNLKMSVLLKLPQTLWWYTTPNKYGSRC
ncbi:MAG: hypothetical protein WBX01_07925 [Nitrososphaeraceae archaeon]